MSEKTFSIPDEPEVGAMVCDRNGYVWKRDGGFEVYEWRTVAPTSLDPRTWRRLLADCGPLTLVEETEDERWRKVAQYLWPDVVATSKDASYIKNGAHAVVDMILGLYAPGVKRPD